MFRTRVGMQAAPLAFCRVFVLSAVLLAPDSTTCQDEGAPAHPCLEIRGRVGPTNAVGCVGSGCGSEGQLPTYAASVRYSRWRPRARFLPRQDASLSSKFPVCRLLSLKQRGCNILCSPRSSIYSPPQARRPFVLNATRTAGIIRQRAGSPASSVLALAFATPNPFPQTQSARYVLLGWRRVLNGGKPAQPVHQARTG